MEEKNAYSKGVTLRRCVGSNVILFGISNATFFHDLGAVAVWLHSNGLELFVVSG